MTVSPADAAVAARSFPRRWRALFAIAAGDEQHDLLARSGALGLADEAASLLGETAARLPTGSRPPGSGGPEPLDRLESGAMQLAAAIESMAPDAWAGAGAIEVLSAGIDGAAALLRQAERALDQARR